MVNMTVGNRHDLIEIGDNHLGEHAGVIVLELFQVDAHLFVLIRQYGEMFGIKDIGFSHYHRAVNVVLELSHVARPDIAVQPL